MDQTYPALHMMIDGERVAGGGRRTFAVLNPATGATIGELPLAETADLDRALAAAARGFARWKGAPAAERAAVLEGAARLLEERREEIARMLAGSVITDEARAAAARLIAQTAG